MSFASFPFSPKTRRAQKPNQPRLLSTSYNSWHSMSRALWQLRATFATSQSCRKWAIRAIAHVVLTRTVCLLVFRRLTFVHQLWDQKTIPDVGVEGIAVWHKGLCVKRRRSSPYGRILGFSRLSSLRTIGSFSRRKKKSSPNGPYFLGHFIAKRLCVDAHYPKHPEKATGPLPTTVASDPTPPDRMPLLPCFHKASSQHQY